jgi:tetratricopeptide (TPR) repeat protein
VLLLRLDQAKEAEVSAARAVALDASQPRYLLTWARALARLGRYDQAESETRKVLESTDLAPVVRAAAYAQLGDLALQGPAVDTKSAIKHHTAAVRLAAPLAGDRVTDVRRLANATLIEAHLGVAQDIAWGDWRGKPEAIAQWTDRAADHVEQALLADRAGALLVLDVASDVLAAHAALRGATDGGIWLEEARDAAEVVLSESDDPHLATEVHWKLALCYYHALQIAHARGDVSESEQYGEAAVENMRQLASLRTLSAEQNHLTGRIFFQLGAVQAVHRQDHREAVRWYDKAAPLLTEPVGTSLLTHVGWHGEALVSMGVSYWEVDRRNEAIAFTERGAQLIAQAVQQTAFLEEALRVPYGNLATMHRQAGEADRAAEFAELARRPSAAVGR